MKAVATLPRQEYADDRGPYLRNVNRASQRIEQLTVSPLRQPGGGEAGASVAGACGGGTVDVSRPAAYLKASFWTASVDLCARVAQLDIAPVP